jgi:hypothetical protein
VGAPAELMLAPRTWRATFGRASGLWHTGGTFRRAITVTSGQRVSTNLEVLAALSREAQERDRTEVPTSLSGRLVMPAHRGTVA